ncbi:MAG: ECF transporter S component [Clostridia bacterium]|nr:ECF transporter S component [Clostridia bacterium]
MNEYENNENNVNNEESSNIDETLDLENGETEDEENAFNSSEANAEVKSESDESSERDLPKKRKQAIRITKKLALTAVLSGLAFGLYMLGPLCKLPLIFPSFLDLQFSELPALIGGFALGPAYGALIIIIKCALKLPMSSTAFTGELCDALLGLAFVLPASIFYRFYKTKKGAALSILIGSVVCVATALLLNRFVIVPTYVKLFFKGEWSPLVGMLTTLFPKITQENFYNYYLWGSVLPFNVLRCLITSLVTFLVYKRVSKLFKKFTG